MSFLDNTGLAYFYSKLKEKFIRSVTAGNDVLTPDASGNINIVNVPTASNLTSPDAQTSYGTFVYRTSGGSASLTSGDAQLMYVDGNMQIVGRIPENFNITATNGIIVSYDADQWRNTIDTSGTYYFRYARPTSSTATQSWSTSGVWTSDGVGEVILSTYGLSVSGVVDPSISTSVSGSGITAATVVPSTFGGEVSADGMYEFTYSTTANSWQYLLEDVSLETYGIAITGTPDDGDVVTINFVAGTPDSVVTVVYTAAERGTIYVPQPTGFSATGFNQFDVDTMVIENATFTSGTIASGANIVAYCRAKGGVDNGYVAYSEGEYILGIGWCAALPEVGSTVVTTGASVAASLASIPFDNDGYVVVEVTDASDLCIHPKWSGAADTDYAEYVAPSTITFPLEDVEDVDLPLKTYGMPRVGAVPDTLDLDAGIYVQRIGRLANTPANMSTVVGYGTDYDYDDDYIYYVLPQSVTYEVEISPDYIVNDWGTEEFLGTEIPCTAQMLYSQNLRDKLRTDVLTISTQTPALTTSELGSVYSNLHLDSFHLSGTITSFPFTIQDDRISERSSVVNVVLGTPASVTSDLTWITESGKVTFHSTLVSSTSTTINFDIAPIVTAVGTEAINSTSSFCDLAPKTEIPSGADFNNYQAAGTYYVITDTVASTISNMPRAASGTLVCIYRSASSYYMQQIYFPTTTSYRTIYTRTYNSGIWTAWGQIPTDIFVITGTRTTSAVGTVDFAETYNCNEYMCLSVIASGAVSGCLLLPYKYGDAANGRWGFKAVNSGNLQAIPNTSIAYRAIMMRISW